MKSLAMKSSLPSIHKLLLPFFAFAALASLADAQTTYTKANNTTALNQVGSWATGIVPTSTDIALWDSTVLAANSSALGADLSWAGIQVTNPGGAVTITGAANTLTLGASGIVLSGNRSLTVTAAMALGANQTWDEATGTTLNQNTSLNTAGYTLNVTGDGSVNFTGVSGTGGLTSASGGTIILNGANSYTGATTINGSNLILNGSISNSSVVTSTSGGTFDLRNSSDFTIGNVITGNTQVWKRVYTDTATFTAQSTYTGQTVVEHGTIKAGVASVAGVSGAFGLNSRISLSNNTGVGVDLNGFNTQVGSLLNGGTNTIITLGTATLTIGGDNTTPAYFAGIMTGSGGLTKIGTGTQLLQGASTYTGPTTINAGAINANAPTGVVGVSSAIGLDSAVTIADVAGATLNTNVSNLQIGSLAGGGTTGGAVSLSIGSMLTTGGDNTSTSFGGVISGGSGLLTKIGTGTQTLTGNNTYTGTTTITAGSLQLGDGGATGKLATTSAIVNNANLTINRSTAVAQGTDFSTAAITGNGSFTQAGAGTTTLNAANTFTGNTLVSAGTLALTNSLALQSSAVDTSGAGVITTGNTTLTLGGLIGSKDLASVITTGYSSVTTLTLNNSGNNTYSGAIANGAMALTKTGAGTQTLSGTNTYIGLTTVNGGALNISGSGLASGNALTLGAGGTADIATVGQTLGAVSNANTAVSALNFSAATGTVTLASLSGAGNTRFGSAGTVTGGISTGTVNVVGLLTGNITGGTVGAGTLSATTVSGGSTTVTGLSTIGTLSGSGTLGSGSLSATNVSGGTNTITGAANITGNITGGTTTVGGVATIGAMSAGTLNLNGATSSISTLSGGSISLGNSTVLTVPDGVFAGGISGGGSLTLATTSDVQLNGTNTYTGTTTIGGAHSLILNGSMSSLSQITSASAGTFDIRIGTTTIGNTIAGNTKIWKRVSAGTVTFTAQSTYTGTTKVSAGILQAGVASVAGVSGAFGLNSAVFLDNIAGGGMALNGYNTQIGSLEGGGPLGGNVTLGTAILTMGGDNASKTFAGIISGSGGLTKIGTGQQNLSGNSTYTGPTTVNGGTIGIFADSVDGVSGAIGLNSAVTIANVAGATLSFANNNLRIGSLAGGGTTGGTLSMGVSSNLFTGSDNTSTSFGGVIQGTGATLTKLGTGTQTLTGNNTYTGTTTITAGSLQLGDGGTTGKISTSSAIVNNANLTVNRSTAVAQGTDFSAAAITGNGSFTQAGAGTTTLSAANTYTGGTTISAGTLVLGVSGGFGNSSGVNLGTAVSHGTLDLTSKASFSFGTTQSVTGFGTINIGSGKTVTVAGTFAPGNSPGQVNVTGNLALAGTTTSTFELAGNGGVKGTDFDNTTATGTMAYAGTLSIVSFGGYSIDTNINLTYSLFDFTGGYSGNFSGVTVAGTALLFDGATNTWGASNGGNTAHYTLSLASGDLTVVPEPATWALLAFSLTTVMVLRRRRHE